MFLTLGEAAKQIGRSKTTLQRAIKSGRLSGIRQEDGSYRIDPSELFRVYQAQPRDSHATPLDASVRDSHETPEKSVHYWQGLHEAVERERDQMQATIDDLRSRLDASETERRATQARLEHLQNKPPQPERGGFWSRIMGRG